MRLVTAALAAMLPAALLPACSESPEKKAEQNAAVANFVPPFVLSRLDFGGVIERRFRRLDRNADDRLTPSELPTRLAGRLADFDTNKDRAISNEEWSAGQLKRFDAQDLNHDGIVTSDEREQARAAREEDLPTPADEPAGNSAAAG